MKQGFLAAGLALLATFAIGQAASAAPVAFTHDYGTGPGQVAPIYGGVGTTASDYVRVLDRLDSGGNRFYDEISFSGFDTINSVTLTLDFADAGPSGNFISGELWSVYGTRNGGTAAQTDRVTLGTLAGTSWTQTFTSGEIFNQALSSGAFAFWFGDSRGGASDFKLYSAIVTVDGTVAPIPLPAAGLLLIGSFGGLVLLRRRTGGAPAL